MLRASAVEIFLTQADLEEELKSHTAGRAEVEAVTLQEGAVLLRLKVVAGGVNVPVPVELRMAVREVCGTEVTLDVSWSNLGLIPGFLKELALQKAFSALPGEYRDGLFSIDLADVLDEMPVQFDLQAIAVAPAGIRVGLRNVMAFPVQPAGVILEASEHALVPVPSTEEAKLPEHQSYYQKLRERVRQYAEKKAPRWVQPLVPWVLAVPDFFVLMVRMARDERVPTPVKLITGAVIAYFILPIDLIPDPIPLVGEVDDVAVALFALEQIAKKVPGGLLQELWPGEGQVLDLVRSGVELFSRALPSRMLEKVKDVLN